MEKNMKQISKGAYLVVYSTVMTALAVLFCTLWITYDCPEATTTPELTEENVQIIKNIQDAETKNDVDSLTNALFGFESK